MDAAVQVFIGHKRIALAGASRSGKKFGNMAYKELTERGYEVYLLHPEAKEIDGVQCYPSLADLEGKVDSVLLSLPASQGEAVLRQAAQAGIKRVWLQQGADNGELIRLGQELDLELVSGKCILMYAPPVRSFHNFHRLFMKLIGQY
jgi:uncharacterized protein